MHVVSKEEEIALIALLVGQLGYDRAVICVAGCRELLHVAQRLPRNAAGVIGDRGRQRRLPVDGGLELDFSCPSSFLIRCHLPNDEIQDGNVGLVHVLCYVVGGLGA